MPTTTERVLAKLDRIETKVDSLHVDVAAIRTEVRVVSTEQRAHEVRDTERFDAIRVQVERDKTAIQSDIRELKSRVIGVEDTSRTFAIDNARATAVLERDDRKAVESRVHDWRKVGAGALITLCVGAIMALAGFAFGRIG